MIQSSRTKEMIEHCKATRGVSRIRVKRAICPLDNWYAVVGFRKRFKWEFKRTKVGIRNQLGNIAGFYPE